jgi:hypothetical protein
MCDKISPRPKFCGRGSQQVYALYFAVASSLVLVLLLTVVQKMHSMKKLTRGCGGSSQRGKPRPRTHLHRFVIAKQRAPVRGLTDLTVSLAACGRIQIRVSMTEPAATAGTSRRVLRIFVLAAAGSQTAFWFYTFRFIHVNANPMGDGLEWMAVFPLGFVFPSSAAHCSRPEVLPSISLSSSRLYGR